MIIIIILIAVLIGIKFIPFGYHEYQDKKMMSNLTIPKLSVFDEECCMFSANFKSFRSVYSLKKELNNIMNNYEKISCNSIQLLQPSQQSSHSSPDPKTAHVI